MSSFSPFSLYAPPESGDSATRKRNTDGNSLSEMLYYESPRESQSREQINYNMNRDVQTMGQHQQQHSHNDKYKMMSNEEIDRYNSGLIQKQEQSMTMTKDSSYESLTQSNNSNGSYGLLNNTNAQRRSLSQRTRRNGYGTNYSSQQYYQEPNINNNSSTKLSASSTGFSWLRPSAEFLSPAFSESFIKWRNLDKSSQSQSDFTNVTNYSNSNTQQFSRRGIFFSGRDNHDNMNQSAGSQKTDSGTSQINKSQTILGSANHSNVTQNGNINQTGTSTSNRNTGPWSSESESDSGWTFDNGGFTSNLNQNESQHNQPLHFSIPPPRDVTDQAVLEEWVKLRERRRVMKRERLEKRKRDIEEYEENLSNLQQNQNLKDKRSSNSTNSSSKQSSLFSSEQAKQQLQHHDLRQVTRWNNLGQVLLKSPPVLPLHLNITRVYMLFALQCPLQSLSRREAAWHWFFAAGSIGALEVAHGYTSMLSDGLKDQLENVKRQYGVDDMSKSQNKGSTGSSSSSSTSQKGSGESGTSNGTKTTSSESSDSKLNSKTKSSSEAKSQSQASESNANSSKSSSKSSSRFRFNGNTGTDRFNVFNSTFKNSDKYRPYIAKVLKHVRTPHLCFFVYGSMGAMFARFNGIPW